jgi:hypothetical protein
LTHHNDALQKPNECPTCGVDAPALSIATRNAVLDELYKRLDAEMIENDEEPPRLILLVTAVDRIIKEMRA